MSRGEICGVITGISTSPAAIEAATPTRSNKKTFIIFSPRTRLWVYFCFTFHHAIDAHTIYSSACAAGNISGQHGNTATLPVGPSSRVERDAVSLAEASRVIRHTHSSHTRPPGGPQPARPCRRVCPHPPIRVALVGWPMGPILHGSPTCMREAHLPSKRQENSDPKEE